MGVYITLRNQSERRKKLLDQEEIRKQVKLAKALNYDIYYKDFAEYLDIKEHSFYNWLNGYYNLSQSKLYKLKDVVADLVVD